MKKRLKVILSLALVVSLICATFTYLHLNALAQVNGDVNDNLKWSLSDDGVFTVSGTGYGADYGSSLTNRVPWGANRSNIKKVIIQEGVQAIGAYWFYSCSNLTSVELPDSLVKIGDHCFQSCSKLENITIPENCLEYYNYVFQGCSSLKWAVLPADNKQWNSSAGAATYTHTIPDNTFYGCTSLENVWVGSSYTSVAANAFRNCSKLSAIIWSGDTISSVSTTNFPSGASFVGTSAIQSWCSSNSRNFINIVGSCGSSLGYSYDLSEKALTLTGSGSMTSAPWNKWKYFIYGADLGGAENVYDNAFNGCEYLGGELTLSADVGTIGSGAFSGAGFDCYIIQADSVDIAADAFGGVDKVTFYGKRSSGAYTYVNSKKGSYPSWEYYCIGSHFFGDGSDKCVYCDKERGVMTIEPLGEHEYIYQHRIGGRLYYKCAHCTDDDYSVSIRDLTLNFGDALMPENDGRFDINKDGIVNGRDLALLKNMLQGKRTDYDMTLTNENATDEANKLYAYIAANYKNKVISGQQESTWMGSEDYEFNYIKNKTGKYPAIRGFDFMGDDFSGCVRRAKAWAKKGGIVTICWHCSYAFDQSYDASKADEFTAEQWEAVLTEGTSEHAAFIAGMDKAANALQQLQNEGIPVLWRPFHEFDGAWFWWGKGGSEYFKRLWIMMYNHYTYDLHLNNLIWVLGFSHVGTSYSEAERWDGSDMEDWYPGNRYVDITGADSYDVASYGAEPSLYSAVYDIVGDAKPLVMHETGLIPSVEQLRDVGWGFFMTWHTTHLTNDNPDSRLNEIYNSDYVITLDELGDIY